jgi:hypothetical protein
MKIKNWVIFITLIVIFSIITHPALAIISTVTPTKKPSASHIKYYGYYYSCNDVEETQGFTNVTFCAANTTTIRRNALVGVKTIVDLRSQLFDGYTEKPTQRLKPNLQDNWKNIWAKYEPYAGNIAAWNIVDEPDRNTDITDYEAVAAEIKKTPIAKDIPILLITTKWPAKATLDKKVINPNMIGSSWIENNQFIIPKNIDWIGFDEYKCWNDCHFDINDNDAPHKIVDLENALISEGKKVNINMKLVVLPGAEAGRTTNLNPITESDKDQMIDLAQKYYDYCNNKTDCIGILSFMFRNPNPPLETALPISSITRVFNKQKELGYLILSNNPTISIKPTISTPVTVPGDIVDTNDNPTDQVNIYDYNNLMENFGKTGSPGFIPADINKDGKVDVFDYNILVGNYEK